jgi:hypothetical protein
VAAFRSEDWRGFVVTGDVYGGMIRMRVAESDELISQWHTFPESVYDVAIAIKGGKVMGVYRDGGVWIWSFENYRTPDERNSLAVADALPPPRVTDETQNKSCHSTSIMLIFYSGDENVAASFSYDDKFVVV